MENIYYLLFFCLICWYFIYLRKLAEAARKHANHYCDQNNLQFIAIARRSSRLVFTKQHGLIWLSLFDVEFSGDGESNNNATLTLFGLKLDNVKIPPYRVN
ncbi:MAG: DUF3301 domain-containing protein [Colwellia sp.]|nr:DUF3301 domain-containing protein [Colwellia sp.]